MSLPILSVLEGKIEFACQAQLLVGQHQIRLSERRNSLLFYLLGGCRKVVPGILKNAEQILLTPSLSSCGTA